MTAALDSDELSGITVPDHSASQVCVESPLSGPAFLDGAPNWPEARTELRRPPGV